MSKITFVFILLMLISCTESVHYTKIVGEWDCLSWINKASQTNKCKSNVHFAFRDDRSYNSKIGSVKDSGKFEISHDILYVFPEGKMKLAVQITKLNSDTLEFLMNQGGVEEILTLLRKN